MADKGRTIQVPVHMGEKMRKIARTRNELSAELGRDPTDEEVAQRLPSDHPEGGHHHHVLVLEVVAVEDVATPVAIEAADHTHYLPGQHVHGVLPTCVLG